MRHQPSQPSSRPGFLKAALEKMFGRKVQTVSPLKQRTEEILRDDRRAVRDPFAHREAIFLID
jgi:hypothetical protein